MDFGNDVLQKALAQQYQFFFALFESVVQRQQNGGREEDAVIFLGDLNDIVLDLLGELGQIYFFGAFEVVAPILAVQQFEVEAALFLDAPEDSEDVLDGVRVGDPQYFDEIVFQFFCSEKEDEVLFLRRFAAIVRLQDFLVQLLLDKLSEL